MSITKRQIAKHLRESANRIAKSGLAKGKYGNQKVGYCALGALVYFSDLGYNSDNPLIHKARVALRSVACPDGIIYWSDTSRQGEVVAAMRKTARALEHGLVLS
jgi:hypothetical protein